MTNIATRHFPNSVWSGLCFQYDSLNIDRYPDFFWADQCAKEIIAVEEYLLQTYIQDLFGFFENYGPGNSFVSVKSDQSALTYRTLVAGANVTISYPNETTCEIAASGGGATGATGPTGPAGETGPAGGTGPAELLEYV